MIVLERYILVSVLTLILFHSGLSQTRQSEWHIGYYAPYLTHVGAMAGMAFDIKAWSTLSETPKREQRLQILTQWGYFRQIHVSDNIILNPEMVYRWNKKGDRFFVNSSIGTGYILSFQRQEGTLNLGTGESTNSYESIHYFVPTLSAGIGIDPKKYPGFYIKASFGRKLSVQNAPDAFMSLATGVIYRFTSKN